MPVDFADVVRRRLVETRQSKHRAAVDGGLPQDAIRSVLNGHSPRLERLEEICDALDLELYVGPPRDTERSDFDAGKIPIRADNRTRAASLTRFNADVQLPVRSWKDCSPEGFLTTPHESQRAPAPEGLDDPQAFYTFSFTYSLVPAGVWSGDHCLVSPCAQLRPVHLIWLRHQDGREAIRLLIRITADAYEVLAWGKPDEKGRQEMMAETWERQEVAERGMLLAIYRGGTPSAKKPPFRVPDWRSDRVADIWWDARKAAEQTGEASHTALDARVLQLLDLLDLEAATLRETTRDWFKRGTVSAHELWELLQEVEKVKQSAYLLAMTMRPPEPASEP